MSELSLLAHGIAALAAVGAGLVNAIAGGGTLISFPVLTALGVPAIRANATNTVSLCPGYISGAYAQRQDLMGLRVFTSTTNGQCPRWNGREYFANRHARVGLPPNRAVSDPFLMPSTWRAGSVADIVTPPSC